MTAANDAALLAQVNAVLEPFGRKATELGPDAVGVMGDAREYGPSVYVSFPPDTPYEQIAAISNEVTNKVRGITRVLMEIPVS